MTDETPEVLIETYCVSCKQKGAMLNPTPVWTSQGRPGTRGECAHCGATVFRMGRTELHDNMSAPAAVQVMPKSAKGRNARAAYIAADATQSNLAEKLGHDLQALGIGTWVDDGEQSDTTQWSTGVHPALEQCTHLIVILSTFTEKTGAVQDSWQFFLKKRKPVLLVKAEDVEPPDALRTRPRFDASDNYKVALRGLVEAISR